MIWEPTVIVPARLLVVMLTATVKLSVAVPLPLAGVTDNQAAPALAVHAQPVPVVTVILPVPPPGPKVVVDATTVSAHDVDAACVTVNVWPATLSVPTRDAEVRFDVAI